MTEPRDLEALKKMVETGSVDTVLACFVDMQGRLMGKRFHAVNFVETSFEETHCCNYLLATDLEMATPDGYASTSWQTGYGDYVMRPDLATIRPVPWLDGTAMVLCDILDHHDHQPVPHAPRAILKKQIKRLEDLGFEAKMATEIEFFLFEQNRDEIRKGGFCDLQPISGNNEDYHILQTTKEEGVMRPIRNHLFAAGLPMEKSKGEAEADQEELNIRYALPLLAPITTPSPSTRSKRFRGNRAAPRPSCQNGTRTVWVRRAMCTSRFGNTTRPHFSTLPAPTECPKSWATTWRA